MRTLIHALVLVTILLAACGDGSDPSGPEPDASGWVMLDVAGNRICGVLDDGRGFCWGANARGELGIGTAGAPVPEPALVAGSHRWKAISTSSTHTCGLTTAGDAYCWGRTTLGALGNGAAGSDDGYEATPVAVRGGRRFEQISAGDYFTCAVDTEGRGWCWGHARYGQLAVRPLPAAQCLVDGETVPCATEPAPAAEGLRFRSIEAGWFEACGTATDGNVRCWGNNGTMMLATDTLSECPSYAILPCANDPHRIPLPDAADQVTLGSWHVCARSGGALYCWGAHSGQGVGEEWGGVRCYNGLGPCRSEPVAVESRTTWRDLTAGHMWSCGLDAAGKPWCWGEYLPIEGSSLTPIPVPGGPVLETLEDGDGYVVCGLTASREGWCWGRSPQTGWALGGILTPEPRRIPTPAPDVAS